MTSDFAQRLTKTAITCTALACTALAGAYPIDGGAISGIRRLEGYQYAQEQPTGAKLRAGQLLGVADIKLGLTNYPGADFDAQAEDPQLKAGLEGVFRQRDPSYALVVIDISDPLHVRWAGVRPDTKQNVGSVGKLISMTALFYALAEAFPNVADRERVLASTVVRAGDWVIGDEHAVPRFNADTHKNTSGRLRAEDEFRLSEWLDHAISVSANGAGSVIWREAMLIRHFGARYPVSAEEIEAFFRDTPKTQLTALAQAVSIEPLAAAGIKTENIRQGSFWTGNGKRKVPGPNSYATPRELARFMFRLEQGRLVDEWSSLEMKRYMYITKRRYRYVYAPELNQSATFFKSGSLYSCKAEEGFRCRAYQGNGRNFMNSVVTVETPARDPQSRYIVTLLSNVLKTNSAWDHSRIGAAIHELVQTRAPVQVREGATSTEIDSAGRSED